MAGIYIHIPLCKSRCAYCDFYSSTQTDILPLLLQNLMAELAERKKELRGEPIQTLYIGGGTPSLLPTDEIVKIIETVKKNYDHQFTEITLEANPDDLNEEYIKELRQSDVNRISIGIQSFDDDDLRLINRRHTAHQAIKAVKCCQNHGFRNLSIDLIYGLPNQTLEKWGHNLRQALALDVPHISAYHLTYEEGTRLFQMKEKGIVKEVDEELSLKMFHTLKSTLEADGIHQYEISNFARRGMEARHNSSYWDGTHYIGIGPSAHSYNGTTRRWNIADTRKYLHLRQEGHPYFETEILSEADKYNDRIITALRTNKGIDIERLRNEFGNRRVDESLRNAETFVHNGLLQQEGTHLRLTTNGIFLSDKIMMELMCEE